jgi:hypothetical protein
LSNENGEREGEDGTHITAKMMYVLYPMEEKETGVIITTWKIH